MTDLILGVYLVDLLSGILVISKILLAGSICAAVGCMLINLIAKVDGPCKNGGELINSKKVNRACLILFILSSFMTIATPSKATGHIILGLLAGSVVIDQPEVSKARELINMKLDEYIKDGYAKDKK